MAEGAGSAGHQRSNTAPATTVDPCGLPSEPSPDTARPRPIRLPDHRNTDAGRSTGTAPVRGSRRLRAGRKTLPRLLAAWRRGINTLVLSPSLGAAALATLTA
ncbi:hypothetical protein AMK24_31755, partial [Streptomyces sp. CB02366]|uniref:hypothetical protein n=1 Tax=Streptomyces sp. CB02366 TaxID=1703935 RepID=UPI0009685FCB